MSMSRRQHLAEDCLDCRVDWPAIGQPTALSSSTAGCNDLGIHQERQCPAFA